MLIGNLIPWRSKLRESGQGNGSTESPLTRFHSEIDRLFDRFFGEPLGTWKSLPDWPAWTMAWSPSLDVSETEDTITVRAEVPGVDPKELDISVSGDVLNICGEKVEETEERSEGYYHSERRFGSFRRCIPLPASVDQERITAEYERGLLTIRLPKTEKAVGRRIPVSVSKK